MFPPLMGFMHRFIPASGVGWAPTLLLLPGTGGDEQALLPFGHALAPGAALLSLRGHVREDGQPQFCRTVEGAYDPADMQTRTGELAAFIADATAAYGVDPQTVVAVGHNNGADMAASLLLLHPSLLAAAILCRPRVPLTPQSLPSLPRTPVFIIAGHGDPIVPPAETERLVRVLRTAGASVTLYWQTGGHGLTSADSVAAYEWMAVWMITAIGEAG